MARFRGTLQGSRGPASRLGHTNSGMVVEAQSWSGAVYVHLYASGDEDCVVIMAVQHGGAGPHGEIFRGPVADLEQAITFWRRRDEIQAMLVPLGEKQS